MAVHGPGRDPAREIAPPSHGRYATCVVQVQICVRSCLPDDQEELGGLGVGKGRTHLLVRLLTRGYRRAKQALTRLTDTLDQARL